jgi:hypothetical protein
MFVLNVPPLLSVINLSLMFKSVDVVLTTVCKSDVPVTFKLPEITKSSAFKIV